MEETKEKSKMEQYQHQQHLKKQMEDMLAAYLAEDPSRRTSRGYAELEMRFYGMQGAPLSKTEYDRVAQGLRDFGFVGEHGGDKGVHIMRIQSQLQNANSGKVYLSNIRAEITNQDLIQQYCDTNNLQTFMDNEQWKSKIRFIQKVPALPKAAESLPKARSGDNPLQGESFPKPSKDPTDASKTKPHPFVIDFEDSNFRMAFNYELSYNAQHAHIQELIKPMVWTSSKKVFRYMNRVRLRHPKYPFFVDLSVVRSSPRVKKSADSNKSYIMVPFHTVQEAHLFTSPLFYEIEVEMDNSRIRSFYGAKDVGKMMADLRRVVRVILSGIQGSPFPLTNTESRRVLQDYLHLLHDTPEEIYDVDAHRILPRDFIGPNPMTLQVDHIVDASTTASSFALPSIRENYTATEKADGQRKLLYVGRDGRIFMIDTNMQVQYTGAIAQPQAPEDKDILFPMLLDGEFIEESADNTPMRLFAIFDVYYWGNQSVRDLPFYRTEAEQREWETRLEQDESFRDVYLHHGGGGVKHTNHNDDDDDVNNNNKNNDQNEDDDEDEENGRRRRRLTKEQRIRIKQQQLFRRYSRHQLIEMAPTLIGCRMENESAAMVALKKKAAEQQQDVMEKQADLTRYLSNLFTKEEEERATIELQAMHADAMDAWRLCESRKHPGSFYYTNTKLNKTYWQGTEPPEVRDWFAKDQQTKVRDHLKATKETQWKQSDLLWKAAQAEVQGLEQSTYFRMVCKRFYVPSSTSANNSTNNSANNSTNTSTTIFDCCNKIMQSLYEYKTDGIIFTPCHYGVGGDIDNKEGPLHKITWAHAFKWKPAHYNTIDFLIKTQKKITTNWGQGAGTKDEYNNNNQEDIETTTTLLTNNDAEKDTNKNADKNNKIIDEDEIKSQYSPEGVQRFKTLILYCGFNKDKDGYYDPMNQLLNGEFRRHHVNRLTEDDPASSRYVARPFLPTDPYDERACLCNVALSLHAGHWVMRTEETGEIFDENMVVEFRYDITREGAWRWIPLRVRHDKTQQMLRSAMFSSSTNSNKTNGLQITANNYVTANSNWYSIHHPVTEDMIRYGKDIPDAAIVDESVYYNRRSTTSKGASASSSGGERGGGITQGLRDFHNLYVKSRLITGTTKPNATLIDFAVGKAGDLAKWRNARLKFVLGIDVSTDNILNKVNGACARYMNEAGKFHHLFKAVFLVGNSAKNIRSSKEAFASPKEKLIVRTLFGEAKGKEEDVGKVVHQQYGVGVKGFDVASCQFALHYFFKNHETLHGFLRNVAECTTLGGLFIGTCFNGQKVFDLLQKHADRSQSQGFSIFLPSSTTTASCTEGTLIFQIKRMYDRAEFRGDDDSCLGYEVSVFQESIGQHIPEYLVHFEYFRRWMTNYGFELVSKEDAGGMGLPNGWGGFQQLYDVMLTDMNMNAALTYGKANQMTDAEKTISFLNMFFVFRKKRDVPKDIMMGYMDHPMLEKENDDDDDDDDDDNATKEKHQDDGEEENQKNEKDEQDEDNIPLKKRRKRPDDEGPAGDHESFGRTLVRRLDTSMFTFVKYKEIKQDEIKEQQQQRQESHGTLTPIEPIEIPDDLIEKNVQATSDATTSASAETQTVKLNPEPLPQPTLIRTGKTIRIPKKMLNRGQPST